MAFLHFLRFPFPLFTFFTISSQHYLSFSFFLHLKQCIYTSTNMILVHLPILPSTIKSIKIYIINCIYSNIKLYFLELVLGRSGIYGLYIPIRLAYKIFVLNNRPRSFCYSTKTQVYNPICRMHNLW